MFVHENALQPLVASHCAQHALASAPSPSPRSAPMQSMPVVNVNAGQLLGAPAHADEVGKPHSYWHVIGCECVSM